MQRLWFIIHRLLWLVASVVVVGGAIAMVAAQIATEYWALNRLQQERWGWVIFYVVAGLLGCQLSRNAVKEIIESRRRTKNVEAE